MGGLALSHLAAPPNVTAIFPNLTLDGASTKVTFAPPILFPLIASFELYQLPIYDHHIMGPIVYYHPNVSFILRQIEIPKKLQAALTLSPHIKRGIFNQSDL